MLMFSDWLMNLLINPLVCAPQYCPLWNGMGGWGWGWGDKTPDWMTCCQWGFQSQLQLCWSDCWFEMVCNLFLWEMLSLDRRVVLDLVIKTSATRCNINDFGRYQRMNLRDAIAWSKPTLIMCLIPSAIRVFLQRFHVEPRAQIKAV